MAFLRPQVRILNHKEEIQLQHLENQLNQLALKTFDSLNKINCLRDSLLILKSIIVVLYYYKNKIELTIKHRDNVFYLKHTQNSFHQILKYLANVKN